MFKSFLNMEGSKRKAEVPCDSGLQVSVKALPCPLPLCGGFCFSPLSRFECQGYNFTARCIFYDSGLQPNQNTPPRGDRESSVSRPTLLHLSVSRGSHVPCLHCQGHIGERSRQGNPKETWRETAIMWHPLLCLGLEKEVRRNHIPLGRKPCEETSSGQLPWGRRGRNKQL